MPVISTLEELDEDSLIEILVAPKNALVKQSKNLMQYEGVDLEIRDEALSAVAKKAMKRKTGARGLRSILENALLSTMYELPSMDGVKKVIVDAGVITDGSRPLFILEDKKTKVAS